jgi:hypothetical protein
MGKKKTLALSFLHSQVAQYTMRGCVRFCGTKVVCRAPEIGWGARTSGRAMMGGGANNRRGFRERLGGGKGACAVQCTNSQPDYVFHVFIQPAIDGPV